MSSSTNGMNLGDILKTNVRLSDYECGEVRSYIKIGVFYVGQSSSKKNAAYIEEYNSKCGFYIIRIGDHIKYQYEILLKIGKGSCGQVIAAIDHKTNKRVAIKIFRCGNDAYRRFTEEVKVYEYLNICYKNGTKELSNMLENFIFRGHPCLVMELYDKDVFSEQRAKFRKGFSLEKVKTIVTSILQGLKALHEVNLMHGDIKLNNISFYKDSTEVKLFDFGSSKFGVQYSSRHSQGRYYRSPELMLALPYGTPIDMWALACVTFELLTGRILFKGESGRDQMVCVMEVLGVPPLEMIRASPVADEYFYEYEFPKYCYVKRFGSYLQLGDGMSRSGQFRRLPKTKDKFYQLQNHPLIVDFILKCLEFDPKKRMTVHEALQHKWLVDQDLLSTNTSTEQPSAAVRASSSSRNDSYLLPTVPNQFFTEVPEHRSCNQMFKSLSLTEIRKPSLDLYHRWALVSSNYWKGPNKGTELKKRKKTSSSK